MGYLVALQEDQGVGDVHARAQDEEGTEDLPVEDQFIMKSEADDEISK